MYLLPEQPNVTVMQLLIEAASERRPEIDAYFADNEIHFVVIEDEHRPLFQASLSDQRGQEIIVGKNSLPRLWAFAHSHVRMYMLAHDARLANSSLDQIEVAEDDPAIALLDWSVLAELNIEFQRRGDSGFFNVQQTLKVFPDGVPIPFRETGEEIPEFADRVVKYAIGFLIHHEFSHLRKRHRSSEGEAAKAEEFEADLMAASWMLDGLDVEGDEFAVRSIGICIALLWMVTVESYLGPRKSNSHPPFYERIWNVLSEKVRNPKHRSWTFAATTLFVHLGNLGMLDENIPELEDAKSAVRFCLEIVSTMRDIVSENDWE